MDPKNLLLELIVKNRLEWEAADKLIRAANWLQFGSDYLMSFRAPNTLWFHLGGR